MALITAAVFVGALLFVVGGPGAKDDEPQQSTADVAAAVGAETVEDIEPTTTTEAEVAATPAQDLKVIVANGTGQSGLAGSAADVLKSQGYSSADAVDGTKSEKTMVYYVESDPAAQNDAVFVAVALDLGTPQISPMPDPVPLKSTNLGASTVLVLLGNDFEVPN